MRKIAAIAVALLVAAGALVVWRKVIVPRRDAARVCSEVEANAASAPARVAGPGARVFILGDSYASGWTLPDPARSFAYALARREHWRATVDGWAGSGYTNPGPCGGHLYADRVRRIPTGTTLTVIEGGLNDTAHVTALPNAAATTIRTAMRRSRRVVVVGPTAAPALSRAAEARVDAALATAAHHAGARYISLLPAPVQFGPDGEHPTAAGARSLAGFIAARLTAPSESQR